MHTRTNRYDVFENIALGLGIADLIVTTSAHRKLALNECVIECCFIRTITQNRSLYYMVT